MSESSIRLVDINPKVTEELLNGFFSSVGKINKINKFTDLSGKHYAEIEFSQKEEALRALNEMNGKELLKSPMKIELVNNTNNLNMERERLGEIIYPIARNKNEKLAAKVTGMLVDAILNIKNDNRLQEILNSETTLVELIEASIQKLNPVQ